MTKLAVITVALAEVPAEYVARLYGACEFRRPMKGDLVYSEQGGWAVALCNWLEPSLCFRLKPEESLVPDDAYAAAHPRQLVLVRDSEKEHWNEQELLAVDNGFVCRNPRNGNVAVWKFCKTVEK